MLVVFIHGKAANGAFLDDEGNTLETDWLINAFNDDNCPRLKAKPKIFVLSTDGQQHVDDDASQSYLSRKHTGSSLPRGARDLPLCLT